MTGCFLNMNKKIIINHDKCTLCKKCLEFCPSNLFYYEKKKIMVKNDKACTLCLSCRRYCPSDAIINLNDKIKRFFISYQPCNNNCIMCYESEIVKKRDVPFQELIKKFESDINRNEDQVIVTGHEITMRKDFFRILKYLKNKISDKTELYIVTNGRIFSYYENVKRLISLGYKKLTFEISILGPNAKIHNAITRTRNSYEETMEGIKNLIDSGINVNVHITILNQNYKYLPLIIKNLIKESINKIQIRSTEPRGRGLVGYKEMAPKFSDLAPYLLKSFKYKDKLRIKNIPFCFMNGYLECMDPPSLWDLKIKISVCKECALDNKCLGIWKQYITLYGGKEITPIIHVR